MKTALIGFLITATPGILLYFKGAYRWGWNWWYVEFKDDIARFFRCKRASRR